MKIGSGRQRIQPADCWGVLGDEQTVHIAIDLNSLENWTGASSSL